MTRTPLAAIVSEDSPLYYRGWRIARHRLGRQWWLRWQHPTEDFPRYGLRVAPETWHQRLSEVQNSIDLVLQLEAGQSSPLSDG